MGDPVTDPSPNRHTPIAADPVVWPGFVYAWLCTPATAEGLARGRACWAVGQIGESAHPGPRMSAKDPLRDGHDETPVAPRLLR